MTEFHVVLHNIRSVHNVGSIFRTADGAGVSKIYLAGYTPTPLDRFGRVRQDFAKVSLGAETSVPWEHERSIAKILKRLRAERFSIVALEQSTKSIPYNSLKPKTLNLKPRLALVVGNEVGGIPPSVLRMADCAIEIPMHGDKESLNVSVAFGIAAYALVAAMRRM